jgi:hypothetical protein
VSSFCFARQVRSCAQCLSICLSFGLVAACGNSASEPSDLPTELDQTLLRATASGLFGSSGRVACPAGGEYVRQSQDSTVQRGDTLINNINSTVEFRSCAQHDGNRTITLDGQGRVTGQLVYSIGPSTSFTLVRATLRQTGSHRIRTDDHSATCAIDVTTTKAAAVRVLDVAGSICGRTVQLLVPLAVPDR